MELNENMDPMVKDLKKQIENLTIELAQSQNTVQQLNNKLTESKSHFHSLFNTIEDYIFILDDSANIVFCNKTALDRLGYDIDELKGKSVSFLHQNEKIDEIQKTIDLLYSGELFYCPYPLVSKNNELIPVETRITEITIEGKKAILGISKDVSRIKMSDEKFSKVFHLSPLIAGISELSSGKYIEVNDSFCSRLGFTRSEVIGKTSVELKIIEANVRREKLNNFSKIIGDEFFIRKKNGEIIKTYASAERIFYQSKECLLTILLDVNYFTENENNTDSTNNTELAIANHILAYESLLEGSIELREKYEELKKVKEKIEESERLKTAFLQNISHEIRTPMNGIIGFSEMLANPSLSDETRKNFTNVIISSSYQLLSIIENIINISKIESGQIDVSKIRVSLNELLDDLYMNFAEKAKSQNLQLFLHKELTNDNANIVTDLTKLVQIIESLLNNAFKFTKQGYIEFGYKSENKHILFFVKDTGIGIAPEFQNNVFDSFWQVDSGNKGNNSGMGVGLSIAKSYVELLEGRIWLNSTPNQETTFYFTIPYVPYVETVFSTFNNSEPSINFTGKTILIADDEKINRNFLNEVFSNTGATIIHAKTGIEAVELCNQHVISIVIMDVRMPMLNGNEATKIIKQQKPNLPIIIQSAYTTDDDKLAAIDAGCNYFISKPIMRKELLNTISKLLEE